MSRYFVQEVYGKRFSGVNPCRSIYPMSSLKVFYHKLDFYNDVHISLEILSVFQPNLAQIWLMHYSVIKR